MWAGNIGYTVSRINIINNTCLVDDLAVATWPIPVMIIVASIYILRRNEYPPIVWTAIINGGIKVVTGA